MDTRMQDESHTAPTVLRVEEAARLLAISRSKTYGLIATGELPSVRIGGSVRVPRRALETWIDDQTHGGRR